MVQKLKLTCWLEHLEGTNLVPIRGFTTKLQLYVNFLIILKSQKLRIKYCKSYNIKKLTLKNCIWDQNNPSEVMVLL